MAPKRDPMSTAQQEAYELTAVHLLKDPAAKAAQDEVAAMWIDKVTSNAAQRTTFEAEFVQSASSELMESLNQDPLYPHIHACGLFTPTREGLRIPGTKVGNPNPDYVNRFIAIDDT